MTRTRRDFVTTAMSGAACFGVGRAHAQTSYPARPITLLVPYAAGGITDILSRLVAERLPTELPGARVIVENRPGAAGMLGTGQVAKGPADGYTVLMGSIGPLVIAKIALKDLAYDPFQDLVPITQVASAPVVMVVHSSVGATTFKEFLALAKANPGKLNYSSAGAGTPSHLSCELLKQKFDIDITHVPYKGTGASLNDLVGGQVQLTMDTAAGIAQFVRTGQLRALVVASATRSPLLPDVATIEELGFGEFDVSGWYGFLATKGTPKAILDTLNKTIRAAIERPDTASRIIEMGASAKTSTPEEFRSLLEKELDRWTPIVQKLNLSFGR